MTSDAASRDTLPPVSSMPASSKPAAAFGTDAAAAQAHLAEQMRPSRTVLETSGRRLQLFHWQRVPCDEDARRAPLVIVHGFGEHAQRYGALAEAVSASGRDVWAFDQCGHGTSSGPRGQLTCDEALSDLRAIIARIGREAPLPPALYGHSMGGAFAAAYVASGAAVSALVLSAPAVHLALRSRWQKAALRHVARRLPRFNIATVNPELLSRDPLEVRAYAEDPLNFHKPVPAVSVLAMTDAGERAFSGADGIRAPVLLIQGQADRIVPPGAVQAFAARLPAGARELVMLPGAFHEPHHDLDQDVTIARVADWLARH